MQVLAKGYVVPSLTIVLAPSQEQSVSLAEDDN
jgi:hypothetical protein